MENSKISDDNYIKFSLAVGFLVWLFASIIFRFFGQYFFITDNPYVMLGLYILLIPAMAIIANWIFKRFSLNKLESIKSAVLMVITGMILDTVCIHFFEFFFPNMDEKDGRYFGSWLMFAYSIVLITGLLRKPSKRIII